MKLESIRVYSSENICTCMIMVSTIGQKTGQDVTGEFSRVKFVKNDSKVFLKYKLHKN